MSMSARIDKAKVANESSSEPKSKTTTAILKLDWSRINGKVLVVCEAKDNQYGRTNITRSEVIVISKFYSLSTYIYIQVCIL